MNTRDIAIIGELKPITIEECMEQAAQTPLPVSYHSSSVEIAPFAKKFDDVIAWLMADPLESDMPGLQRSAAGDLARAFFAMLQVAQKAGVSTNQIMLAIQVQSSRHCHAIESKARETGES